MAIFDVPGSDLQIELTKDKFTLLLLEGKLVDMVCEINHEYKHHVRNKYIINNLYFRILKTIYGMIDSALIWYELYTSVLKDIGFYLNPYDMCMGKKYIHGKQCTIVWYTEKNLVSHVEQYIDQ